MKTATREFSDDQEKRVARILGGRVQIGSGSTPYFKGDVVADNYLFECKTKTKVSKTHSIQKAWFEKAKKQAFETGLEGSFLVFDFGDGEDYVSMDIHTFINMFEVYLKSMEE